MTHVSSSVTVHAFEKVLVLFGATGYDGNMRKLETMEEALAGIPEGDRAATPERVQRLLVAMSQELVILKAEVKRLREENRHLREQLGLNSRNSSTPPSADSPGARKPKRRVKSGKRRGGQPGHKGSQRRLIPTAECHEVIELMAPYCRCCGKRLHERDPEPQRHQVVEIPEIRARVTEFQRHRLLCSRCHHINEPPPLPAEARGVFGPRLQALIALLNGSYRVSIRQIQVFLRDLFGVEISCGQISKLRFQAGEAVAWRVEEVHDFVKGAQRVNVDETGYRRGVADGKNPKGRKAWLWTAVTEGAAAFTMSLSRGRKTARELLGESFSGIVGSDRWGAYNWIDTLHRQLCWAHLIRDFRRIAERDDEDSRRIGERLLEESHLLFSYWHRVRDGTLKRSSFQVYASNIRQRIRSLLSEGAQYRPAFGEKTSRARTARTCKALLKLERALWTFARREGVEPTNNAAERAIRPAVIWRKTSYGTESEKGSEYVARMMTVIMTLKMQGRNVFEYMIEACMRARRGEHPPSLLPAMSFST